MVSFRKPDLSLDQKRRLKKLYKRDNYHGLIAILSDIACIAICVYLAVFIHPIFIPAAIIIIGTRQRALATILHEAAHGTLFHSQKLNSITGRIIGGWPILQSFQAYRISHVLHHHPKIGDLDHDPDFKYMYNCGVYSVNKKSEFIRKYLLKPFIGSISINYIKFLLKDRLFYGLKIKSTRYESIFIILINICIFYLSIYYNFFYYLILLWWIPFLFIHPIVGWFIELSEHYPLMVGGNKIQFYSRNRYSGILERFFIGMHGENFHLTHHLLPGVPYWNLKAATKILQEDKEFCIWDEYWGGIFSSDRQGRTSLIQYIMKYHCFNRDQTLLFIEDSVL